MIEYLRFLFRNKWYTTVEVIGIGVALAFTIPLLSFFSDKWEIDHGKDFKRVYAVCPIETFETTIGLGLSPETVKWYRKKLLVKFDVANTAELTSTVKDMGLI